MCKSRHAYTKKTLRSTELEKLVAAQLINKLPPFCGTDSFMWLFTRTHPWFQF